MEDILEHTTIGDLDLGIPELNWFNSFPLSLITKVSLKHSIQEGTALAVSDGSYFPIEEI